MNEIIDNLINELVLASYDTGHASGIQDREGYDFYLGETTRLVRELRAEIRKEAKNA